MTVIVDENVRFEARVPVLIIGAGACGLVAGLTVKEFGADVVILERDAIPRGSTSLSSGMIPACNTRFQKENGVRDSTEQFAEDIFFKAKGNVDRDVVLSVCEESGRTVEWLVDCYGVQLQLVKGFLYPGHTALRMHAPPSRTGAELIESLVAACERVGIDILTNAQVTKLFSTASGMIRGVEISRPNNSRELIGCEALILACNGYGGSPKMVEEFIPEISNAIFAGHDGNQGDAVLWGRKLGAAICDMGAYQGHGSWAVPSGILITWAVMTEGGIQVNCSGKRFANEHEGYSEAAVKVLAQEKGLAWNIYDSRIHEIALDFEDYRSAETVGAIKSAENIPQLAEICGISLSALARTITHCKKLAIGEGQCSFGRNFAKKPPLKAPYYAVCVTGALFHTQGGLAVDTQARVLQSNGIAFPNLFAGGGAARGVSGYAVWGYLSGNGLLTAVTLGRISGRSAVAQVKGKISEK